MTLVDSGGIKDDWCRCAFLLRSKYHMVGNIMHRAFVIIHFFLAHPRGAFLATNCPVCIWAWSILSSHTFATSCTIMQPIFSSSCFHTTKANMVFFGDLDGLFDTLCSKSRAGIWPMGRAFTVPAFIPLLVGCVDLNSTD